jgi:hypothetical protein
MSPLMSLSPAATNFRVLPIRTSSKSTAVNTRKSFTIVPSAEDRRCHLDSGLTGMRLVGHAHLGLIITSPFTVSAATNFKVLPIRASSKSAAVNTRKSFTRVPPAEDRRYHLRSDLTGISDYFGLSITSPLMPSAATNFRVVLIRVSSKSAAVNTRKSFTIVPSAENRRYLLGLVLTGMRLVG